MNGRDDMGGLADNIARLAGIDFELRFGQGGVAESTHLDRPVVPGIFDSLLRFRRPAGAGPDALKVWRSPPSAVQATAGSGGTAAWGTAGAGAASLSAFAAGTAVATWTGLGANCAATRCPPSQDGRPTGPTGVEVGNNRSGGGGTAWAGTAALASAGAVALRVVILVRRAMAFGAVFIRVGGKGPVAAPPSEANRLPLVPAMGAGTKPAGGGAATEATATSCQGCRSAPPRWDCSQSGQIHCPADAIISTSRRTSGAPAHSTMPIQGGTPSHH